jgi:hypothetical protein
MSKATKKVLSPPDLLAAAAALAAGTQAYGEVVIFINPPEGEPGHFDWSWIQGPFPGTPEQWLDITRPSTDQDGGLGPSSVGQAFGYGSGVSNLTLGGASVVAFQYPWGGPYSTAMHSGETIDGGTGMFESHARHAVYVQSGYGGDPHLNSNFETGVPSYMGVRFIDVDGYQYGWIGVVRHGNDQYGLDFDAFAWGHETEPGVPIVAGIPAPGTLAALAFGAVVTRRGRKREGN